MAGSSIEKSYTIRYAPSSMRIWLLSLSLAGCALSPLTDGMSARSLEAGSWEVQGQMSGYQEPGRSLLLVPSARVFYGLTGKTTLGAATEFRSFTGVVKYSLLTSAFSLALNGRASIVGGGVSYGAGLSGSYQIGVFEPYVGCRVNLAFLNPNYLDPFFFATPPAPFSVFSTVVTGLKVSIFEKIAVGAEVLWLFDSASVRFSSHQLVSVFVSL